MSQLVGYIGLNAAAPVLLEILNRVKDRGYDSVDIATISRLLLLDIVEAAGEDDNLTIMLPDGVPRSQIDIGHSLWATHDESTPKNAHPHVDSDNSVAVVHHGVLENRHALRDKLESQGYEFCSDTDSEIIAHQIHSYLYGPCRDIEESGDVGRTAIAAFGKAVQDLHGTYAIVVSLRAQPDLLLAARRVCQLAIGAVDGGGYVVGSDSYTLCGHVSEMTQLGEDELAIIRGDTIQLFTPDLELTSPTSKQLVTVSEAIEDLWPFDHFTQKEIHNQSVTLRKAALDFQDMDSPGNTNRDRLVEMFDGCQRISIAACGSSRHSALYAKYIFEELVGVPVDLDHPSEYRSCKPHAKNTIMLALSHSGETADTLAALRHFQQTGQPSLAICNVPGSTLADEADVALLLNAGQESGVATTKAYTSELALLADIAITWGEQRAGLNGHAETLRNAIAMLPGQADTILNKQVQVRKLAKTFHTADRMLFVGRGYDVATALEGARMMRGISHLHAEGYAAGELKHRPSVLPGLHSPTVAVATPCQTYREMLCNLQDVAARTGPIIAVVDQHDPLADLVSDHLIRIPTTVECLQPILNIIPLQLLAYHIAVLRGCHVDRPRRLAERVPVK